MDDFFIQLASDSVLAYLQREGIASPTEIQRQTAPPILEGRDVIGLSETGSGKTLAYLLPLLAKIDMAVKVPQAVVLAPTRELALQVCRVAADAGASAGLFIGGASISRQLEVLRCKPRLIVGSPGRILELNRMKKLTMHHVKTMVIDEADRLLDADNIADLRAVVKTTRRDRQLLFFSATMDHAALKTAESLAQSPVMIASSGKAGLPQALEHMVFLCEQRKKIETLRKIVHGAHIQKALVFLNKPDDLDLAVKRLNFHGLHTAALLGAASKHERQKALNDFRAGRVMLLAASDLAARGLHIDGLTHVISLDTPENPSFYLHRAGRAGRMGQAGTAITLATPREMVFLKNIEKQYGITIAQKEMRLGNIVSCSDQKRIRACLQNPI